MRFILLFVLLLLSITGVSAQNVTPKNADIDIVYAVSESDIAILQPDQDSAAVASGAGFNVFKILPRDMFAFNDNELKVRGGGAYYSFTNKSHSYNAVPQIGLEKGKLSVGFYGTNYGFFKDLGNVDLTSVNDAQKEVVHLARYTPPLYEPDIRKEAQGSDDYLVEGINYRRRVDAVTGHTYVLRAINFREADTLVAFNIQRINDDGSMVILWKPIREFEVPKLLYQTDAEIKAKLDEILKAPQYADATAHVSDNKITLQGYVIDREYTNLIRKVMEIRAAGLINKLIKKVE